MNEPLRVELPDELLEALAARLAPLVAEIIAARDEHDGPRYLTVREAARHLSMSEHALRHAIARGQLGGVVQDGPGHRIRIDAHALDAHLRHRVRPPRP